MNLCRHVWRLFGSNNLNSKTNSAIELIFSSHDSFTRKTKAAGDEREAERGKVLIEGFNRSLWGYAEWVGVGDVSFSLRHLGPNL